MADVCVCVCIGLLATLQDAHGDEEKRRSEACHAMCNQAKSRSSLSFVSLSKPRRCPGGRLGKRRRRSGRVYLDIVVVVSNGELDEMGVPLSKNRVIRSCLDIHYVFNPSENGRVPPTPRLPPLPQPPTLTPPVISSEPVKPVKRSSSGEGCHLCRMKNPTAAATTGSPISWMSTESVAVDNDSVQSLQHTHTVDCWSSAVQIEDPSSSTALNGCQLQPTDRDDMEECAVCSSAGLVVINNNEQSLIVQIHASDDVDQLVARTFNRPDKTLFQLPQVVSVLESTDGYLKPFHTRPIPCAFSLDCLSFFTSRLGLGSGRAGHSFLYAIFANNNRRLYRHLGRFPLFHAPSIPATTPKNSFDSQID